ncbi:hypothetical protein COO60DRAFT_1272512 [Scenedesmus sp. NREL 46B-D3]|nr:hypothetical protein COO60DRAFT_1272512 [Scenedesmus sp. NREL 46B-D3]
MRQAAAAASAGSGVRTGAPHVPLHLVWTTAAEVQRSREGWAGGGSIPGRRDNVVRPFLQRHYCRWGGEPSGRQSAMPHIKTYTRYLPPGGLAWCVVASHNLSKAAWGGLQKGGSQLMVRRRAANHCCCCRSCQLCIYELGVLLTPELEAAHRAHPHSSSVPVLLPIPYLLPPQPYGPGDVPWRCDTPEQFPGVDAFGYSCGNTPLRYYGNTEPPWDS